MAVMDHVKQALISERFDNTTSGMNAFKAWLKSTGVSLDEYTLLVIENTGVYHRLLWNFCSKYNLPLHIGNAAHIKWSLGITRGKSIKGRVHISKIGGKQLRHTLYMCALNAKATNMACKALYDRLVAKGKNKELALIAVCNKLLKQVFAVVKSNTLYNDNYPNNFA
jgi:transposase